MFQRGTQPASRKAMIPDPADNNNLRGRPSDQVEELKADVERLLLITESLWKIVQEKHGLEDTELLKRMTLLDMADGKLDARKPRTPPKPCPQCQRALPKRRPKCMFCGAPVVFDPFER